MAQYLTESDQQADIRPSLKRTVLRLAVLGLAILAINQIPRFFLAPYYGNQIYAAKHAYFEEHHKKYNSVILGSMRLYRQLDPALFDAELATLGLSTFNLAAPTTDHPEVLFLYEQLLDQNDRFRIKRAVIELQPLNYILSNNVTAPRNYYWHNFSDFSYAVRYVLDGNFTFAEKTDYIYKYLVSYLANLTNLYGFKALRLPSKPNSVGRDGNGYYALDDELLDHDGPNFFSNRLADFMLDGEQYVKQRTTTIAPDFDHESYSHYLNKTFLNRIIDVIRLSDEKGVTVLFVIPPRFEAYLDVLAIKEALPSGRVIEIANPREFADLYSVSTSFDKNYLNKAGAQKFTQYLAAEILENPLSD